MGRWMVLGMALTLALAGCLGDDAPDTGDDGSDDTNTPEQRAPLPDPIEASEMVVGGVDVTSPVLTGPCETEGSTCHEYPFEVLTDVRMDATLSWSLDGNDFDLYLYEDGEEVASAVNPAPQTSESIATSIGPGSYTLVVVAWLVGQDTYTLSAGFEYA